MKNQIVFLMLILISASVFAQQMMGPPAGDYVFKGEDGVIEIPFQLIQNHVILTADLNGGNSVKLVLDTGMPAHGAMLYKTKQIEDLNLKFSGQAMVGGAGGELKPADILMGASLSFPGLEFNGIDIVILPHDEISRRVFTSHDGVIGYSFFSRFVMEFDFEKMILKVIEPDKFDSTGKGTEIPIEIARFEEALIKTREEILIIQSKISKDMGVRHAQIFDAHLLVLEDRTIIQEVIKSIKKEKMCVEYIFSQVMNFLPLRSFHQCVARYKGEYKVQKFSCLDQYLCMAFAQLTYRESLRDIETCMRALRNKLYHMGIRGKISLSTLADANEKL